MNRRLRPLKYLSAFSLPVSVSIAFIWQGYWSFFPLAYVFGVIPIVELLISPSTSNLTKTEEALVQKDLLYDWLLYLSVPIQYILLFYFFTIVQSDLTGYELVGCTLSMGLMCGGFGINIAHELGHRSKPFDKLMAKILLLTSLYMHFYIEHNRGHHKHVATEKDPASARYGEALYVFWFRSVIFGYLSAWQLEHKKLRQNGKSSFSLSNQMLLFQLIQMIFVITVGIIWGLKAVCCFIGAAVIGFLLLETVNYIEHYGLNRKATTNGRYERVQPHHSWNSNHLIGRLLLFELSRHSDHHYIASRKYPILRHHENSPQMPTGYPGMMLLALLPPIWFGVMHPKIRTLNKATEY
ncbi:alkane 1-monooxygenase [Limibacter armeniacum]|uniref:alkane 1-monooxygenase n=1 Tax=Limibacter armeniacum TaxID=466084 RepID=UPI002FE54179